MEIFEKRVDLYEELVPYKDYFAEAIHFVNREYLDENMFKVNYSPGVNSSRRTCRIKIDRNVKLFNELYEEIKEVSNIQNERALVNNILSSLIGISQYAPRKKIPLKEQL